MDSHFLFAQCKGNMLKYLLNKNKKKISSRLKSSLLRSLHISTTNISSVELLLRLS